ncbi:melanoregulin [Grus japonensis]|uniref:Melanoregulin n=1 Tax=Grus japonensis TaxID=30415 RepID=A0ABC9X2K7_GRUJA
MGLGAWLRSLGGCCGCCGGEAAAPEKEPLLSNNNPYASFGATLARDEEQNLWSTPHDVTHTEADDDRVLYNMIVVRNQLDKDSEEWQKLNYDIYTLRQTRKEVRSRWKHILEDLGFQKEADSLLSVTKLSIISDSQNMGKARDILLKLSEETNIFPTSWELSERYLFVVDRLIALDAADEFFKMASVASQTEERWEPGARRDASHAQRGASGNHRVSNSRSGMQKAQFRKAAWAIGPAASPRLQANTNPARQTTHEQDVQSPPQGLFSSLHLNTQKSSRNQEVELETIHTSLPAKSRD